MFPISLFVFTAILRIAMPARTTDWTLDSFKQASYPVGKVNLNQTWVNYNFTEKQRFQDEVQDFYKYANFTNTRKVNSKTKVLEDIYVPDYDFVGPYFYYPMACYSKRGSEYGYPIIGYVENGNEVERALVAQYQMVFKSQTEAAEMINQVPDFMKKVSQSLGINSQEGESGQLSFAQIIGNQGPQIPFEIIQYAGGIQDSDAQMGEINQFGHFRFQAFPSKESLEDYLASPDYNTPEKPGMCFGFQVSEDKSKRKYELEVFSNDKWPNIRRFSADGEIEEQLPYSNQPNLNAYQKFAFNGFHMIENWTANIILQLRTKKPEAKIVSLLSPQLNGPLVADGFQIFLESTFYHFILLMYFPLLYRLVYRIVDERQSRNKHLMQQMGMKVLPYWLSWWASFTVSNLLIAIFCGAIAHFKIFAKTSDVLLFLVIFLIGQAQFGLVWISTTLFDSPQMATIVLTVLIWGGAVMEPALDCVNSWTPSVGMKVLICLINPMFTIKQTMRTIIAFDNAAMIVSITNSWNQVRQNFTVNEGILLLICNFLLSSAISLWLEIGASNIKEKDSNCCFMRRKPGDQHYAHVERLDSLSADASTIIKLSKTSDSQKNLQSVNVILQANKIIALCGPNGSGKTTYLSELSKQLFLSDDQNNGELGELSKINVGILLSQITLFDNLTPIDHLELYSRLKGNTPSHRERMRQQEYLQQMLISLGFDKGDSNLPGYFNTVAKNIPTAEKKALQIAIAISWEPQVLLLDDPFSGLSPNQAQNLMALLREMQRRGQQMNQPRYICFSTPFKAEAKKLADKIFYLQEDRISDVRRDIEDSPSDDVNTEQQKSDSPSEDYKSEEQKQINDTTYADVSQIELVAENHKRQKGMSNEMLQKTSLNSIVADFERQEQPFELAKELNSQFSIRVRAHELSAIFSQRWQCALSNKKSWIFQLLGPICVTVLGWFACRTFITIRTPSRVISPHFYDNVQQIMLNLDPVFQNRSDISPKELAANLDSQEMFEIQYANSSVSSNFYKYQRIIFDKDMRSARPNYGSYLIYQLDRHQQQYKFATLANTTEGTAAINFPAFMYEAVLKTALRDPEFEFKVRTTPYPLTPIQKQVIHRSPRYFETINFFTVREYIMNKSKIAEGPIFAFSACYIVLMASILHRATKDRLSKLKQLQMIAGLPIASYWFGNYLFDVLILIMMAATTITLSIMLDTWKASLIAQALWPIVTVPFCYGFNFFFDSTCSTQYFLMTGGLCCMLVLAQMVFAMRLLSQFEFVGDCLMWVNRLIPTYPVINSFYLEATVQEKYNLRKFTKQFDHGTAHIGDGNAWSVYNCMGDIAMMMLQLLFWVYLIFMIELEQIKRIKGALRRNFWSRQQAQEVPEQPAPVSKGIYVQNLTYENRGLDLIKRTYFTNVSFHVRPGQLLTLISTHTAQKTALIQSIIHEVVPTQGIIQIGGVDMSGVASQYPKGLIGYCPQQIILFQDLTVLQHLEYFAGIKGVRDILEIETLIFGLNLNKDRDLVVSQISGGSQRMLQIAIALLGRPKALIIDGAFDGLDTTNRGLVCKLLKTATLEWGSAVLVVVSSLSEALHKLSAACLSANSDGWTLLQMDEKKDKMQIQE